MSDNFTFWRIISENRVQIPVIQRDYAQGREKQNIERIRKNFLEAIYESLTDPKHQKRLHLDFVYGSVRNGNFIPLDGQQRLTTLFLLHWYLAWKDNALDGEARELLSKFTYKTRVSSASFCSALVNNTSVKNTDVGDSLSEAIKKSAWFFAVWNRDPTIKSMLRMLDDIHGKFRKTQNLFSLLKNKEECPLSFNFLDLEEFKLGDDLYIRMNARGKSLTDFEIYKSSLLQRIESLECGGSFPEGYKDSFMRKMDVDWLEFFWEKIGEKAKEDEQDEKSGQNELDEKSKKTDEAFLFFLNIVFDNFYYTTSDKKEYENLNVKDMGRISKEEIEKISGESILELEKILDVLAEKNNRWIYDLQKPVEKMNGRSIIGKVIEAAGSGKFEYSDNLKFFAFCSVITIAGENQKPAMREWMRVTRNLTEGVIYNNFSEYVRDLKLINSWKPFYKDISGFIANDSGISSSSAYQLQEEKLKAVLITKNGAWKAPIERAEDHPYFAGQIGFLLDFAGVDQTKPEVSAEDEEILSSFQNYSKKAEAVFNGQGVAKEENLWRRALLCMGNYTLRTGSNTSFVINGYDRDISWKRLLRDSGEKRHCVKELLKKIEHDNIKESLENVIGEKKEQIDDWRKYFIIYPQIMENECGKDCCIRITNNDKNDILLLLTTRASGTCKEYYSYALYRELKEKYPASNDIKYEYSCGYSAYKGLSLCRPAEGGGAPRIYITYGSARIPDDREIKDGAQWNGKWITGASTKMKSVVIHENKEDLIKYLRNEKYIQDKEVEK